MSYRLIGLDDSAGVIRLEDGASLPADLGNRDWREYWEWKSSGGLPESAPPAPTPEREAEALIERPDWKALGILLAQLTGKTVTEIRNAYVVLRKNLK